MSHLTVVKTKMMALKWIKKALKDLGFTVQEGKLEVVDYYHKAAKVELKATGNNCPHPIGFAKKGKAYEIVADWYEMPFSQTNFTDRLTQRYAYHAARETLQEHGFSLVLEEKQGQAIHLRVAGPGGYCG